ncbi:unnamed protein product, partial [Oppiella nova]
IITGANTGIGKETALQLSLRGAKIYIGCRSLEKADAAVDDIRKVNPKADITSLQLDLSSFKSVRQFASQVMEREAIVDILINNAGIYQCPEWETVDGFEMQFGTNHLGPFLLTLTLLPLLRKAPKARVVNVASGFYEIGKIYFDNINLRNGKYDPQTAYCQSKLAMVMCTREMAKRLGNKSNVTVYVLNPGVVKTELQRHQKYSETLMKMMFLSPEMGAQTTLYCTLQEELDGESGFYYDNCKRVDKLVKQATNEETTKIIFCNIILTYYINVGPFLLTLTLLPHIKRAPVARIVNVSSSMHAIGKIYFDNINLRNGKYTPTRAYGQSKLAVVLGTRELAKRLGNNSTVTCYVLNPGAIKTDLQRHSDMSESMMNMMFMKPDMGAQTTLYCTLQEELDHESGFYYNNCKRVDKMVKQATDDETANMLWELTCDLVALEDALRI